jgi:hypothetical protein
MRPLPLPYYHCMVCPDYDLCPSCEDINSTLTAHSGEKIHDGTHAMIKYKEPPK